jgi:hypothetical protein
MGGTIDSERTFNISLSMDDLLTGLGGVVNHLTLFKRSSQDFLLFQMNQTEFLMNQGQFQMNPAEFLMNQTEFRMIRTGLLISHPLEHCFCV